MNWFAPVGPIEATAFVGVCLIVILIDHGHDWLFRWRLWRLRRKRDRERS